MRLLTNQPAPTPAVVLGSGHHGALGVARSLGRLGAPVYIVAGSPWEPAICSRYCRGRFFLDLETGHSEQLIDGLLAIGRKLGSRPLLIPTADRESLLVAKNSAALAEQFCFPPQNAALVSTLCDKSRMQELARQNGLPTAQSMVPRTKDDVAQFAGAAVFPVMVKATHAERFRRRTGHTKFLIRTRRELLDLYTKAEDGEGPNFLIQEFIPGEDWMFNGYFDSDSRCKFGLTGKKVRRFPADGGVTSLGVCLRNDAVHHTTTEFMRAIGYRGILDIGFRYDRRDGQYKILDVNPRIGCTFRLFTAKDDMDVAKALYLDLTDRPPSSAAVSFIDTAEGRKWIVEDFDLWSALTSLSRGAMTLTDWLKSLRGIRETACFAFHDPLPSLMMAVADCCELCRRRL